MVCPGRPRLGDVTGPERAFQELKAELLALFRKGAGEPLGTQAFNDLALRVFRFQCETVPSYRAFVQRRGVDPEVLERWEGIPFLPTGAFKSRPLVSGDPAGVERVFRTSGTVGGGGGRGEHHVRDLALYRGALLSGFRAHLLPEGRPLPVLNLLCSPEEAPESSLSFMMGEVLMEVGGGRGGFFADPGGGIRAESFRGALDGAEQERIPVLVAATAFALVHWLDTAEERGWRFRLPEGSRLMETGGYKGRSRVLSREELYRGLEAAFGIPRSRIVNEYGMTELLSQFYEPVLAVEGDWPLESRYHRGPPWVRTLVLDPLTLAPLGPGETGVLAHLDLANLGSVSALLTQDLGRSVPGGFRLQGRSPGAEPRGCSLAMEHFLSGPGSRP